MLNRKGHHKSGDWYMDIKIAKELLYSKEVIEALENEPDPSKRNNILRKARLSYRR